MVSVSVRLKQSNIEESPYKRFPVKLNTCQQITTYEVFLFTAQSIAIVRTESPQMVINIVLDEFV